MEVEERRMQLRVVAASRPVLGAGLQALASPPGGAAETERLRLEEKRSYHQTPTAARSAGPLCIHDAGSTFTCSTHACC